MPSNSSSKIEMLKFFLDEHISPKVAVGLRRLHPELIVESVVEWKGGVFRGREDADCLEEASKHGFVFVTYDQKTIRPILQVWLEEGRHHGGIVFVDDKTVFASDFGRLIRALARLATECAQWEW